MMKRRFFFRNFLLVTLPVVLVIVLLGWMAIYIINSNAKKSINENNVRTISRIRESTELMFSEADAQSLNYSVSPHVMLRLEELLENGYADKENLDVSYMIKTFVDSNVNSKPYLHSIYIYLNNTHGNFFASFVGLANETNFRDTGWMQKAEETPLEQKQWLELRNINTYAMTAYSTNVLSVYKRIYASNKQTPIGILLLNIKVNYLNAFFSDYLSFSGQSILLLNQAGDVLCSSGEQLSDKQLDNDDLSALEKTYFVAREDNSAYGVTYLSLIPRAAVYQMSRDILGLVEIAILISLLLGSTIAYITTRRNTKDISAVVQLIEAAENGQEMPIIKPSADVYGFIMQNIVKSFLERNVLDRQLVEKKYRLEAMYFSFLQSQLNPHFLFNTLKNIFWKTVKLTGQQNEASHMIDLLSGVLYYALVNQDRYVLLEKEIENTEKYLQIQQLRFDGAFSVSWNIDVDTSENKCIKFLLQPLVENSLSHGLQNTRPGEISIAILQLRQRILFQVTDNGAGFTQERLDEIRQRMRQEDSPVQSIGLYNLNRRLVLAYGEDSALQIESIPGVETTIRFSIPVYREKNEIKNGNQGE